MIRRNHVYLLKEILCQYFEEINEEVSIVEYDSGETLIADVEEGYIAMDRCV